VAKSSPKICATSVIFKRMAKVNNRPSGENSPNLVTLLARLKIFIGVRFRFTFFRNGRRKKMDFRALRVLCSYAAKMILLGGLYVKCRINIV
jgi:hypothetical protein